MGRGAKNLSPFILVTAERGPVVETIAVTRGVTSGLLYGALTGYNTSSCAQFMPDIGEHGTREDVELTSRLIMEGQTALRFPRIFVKKRCGGRGGQNTLLQRGVLSKEKVSGAGRAIEKRKVSG